MTQTVTATYEGGVLRPATPLPLAEGETVEIAITRPAPPPALTEEKVPEGGEACPKVLSPQQASVPSLFTPQLWKSPALTEEKVPDGGVDCPKPLSPQQASVPSLLTPQLW